MMIPKLPTYEEWRKSDSWTKEAALLIGNDNFQIMLAILQHEGRRMCIPYGSSETDTIRLAGAKEGFEACLDMLLKFAEPIVEPSPVEMTFKDDSENTKQE